MSPYMRDILAHGMHAQASMVHLDQFHQNEVACKGGRDEGCREAGMEEAGRLGGGRQAGRQGGREAGRQAGRGCCLLC